MGKRTNPSDVANAFIRCLLSDISEIYGGFSDEDEEKTREKFTRKKILRCIYSGKELKNGNYSWDHLIPINQTKCGLNLFGNVVPVLEEYNSEKGGTTYIEFIKNHDIFDNLKPKEKEKLIKKIEKFQTKSNYSAKVKAIGDLQEICEEEYDKITNLCKKNAIKYSKIILKNNKGLLSACSTKKPKGNYTKDELKIIKTKINKWSKKPDYNHHKIIALFIKKTKVDPKNGFDLNKFIDAIGKCNYSQNPLAAIRSLMTSKGHAYGKIFMEEKGKIKFVSEIDEQIRKLPWKL
ncbi:hypothetical protein [Leadbettera azotonutricia]|uniref:HNH endonuclease n=1 Tax=Leadbettera azotonutricia (strain ATCC BAA-888 / DSM 13862 / ZAS-9) TaxID=545695 RepID=F5YE58_LEAAZ|nr:hypothetical protein [Leadbettera azotonutricia]AEF81956.1 hypothetical protein TREAZ_0269 [Leadbettera azotonutricia ZAS-9]